MKACSLSASSRRWSSYEAFLPFWAFSDPRTILALETRHFPAALGIIGGLRFFGRSVAVRA